MEENKITTIQYREGVYDICEFLYEEMKEFLYLEDRYYGRVKSYMNNFRDLFKKTNSQVTLEESEVYGRVLYQVRSQIYKDFSKLAKRRLSPADRVIIIIKKLVDILNETQQEETQCRFEKEIKTIDKVINKMFDNIRNKGKNDSLSSLSSILVSSILSETYGKFSCDNIDLVSIENPKPKKLDIVGEETLISEGNNLIKKKEINL